ncbi:restriction endonuclease subunit S [Anoxybacillus flavithermus]|uniref:restriction endonuclease subunit S n=1 Tax=Anoxybacillus flavithermus TaxID=33934 RepID=UPI001868792D|nr:restriction endonuclease subunit S [Anoxybacillus flavithermus]
MNSQTSSWQLKKLEDICEVRKGKFDPKKEPNTIYIGLEHIEQQTGRLLGTGDSGETTSIKSIFKTGDVLFGKLRPYLRKYWFATFDGVCATEILPLTPKKGIDSKFLFYIIQQDKFVDYLDQKSYGTKMPRTSWKEMAEYNINLPPLSEQRKIAAILSSVDEAIEKTEAIIEQTEKVKKGLMQQLLTKGIGHTKFKKTEIGEIPEGWEVVELQDLANPHDRYAFTGGPFGSDLTAKEYTDEGVQIIQLQNIKEGYFSNDYQIFTSEAKADELLSCNIYPGDIIIAKMAEPVARACIVPNHAQRFVMASDGVRLSVDKERFVTDYVVYAINAPYFREQAINNSTGTTRLRIGLSALRKLKILIPPYEEQQKIADIMTKISQKIEAEKTKIEKLTVIKKGLMQVLLTGKVRVKVDDEVNNPTTKVMGL